VRDLEQLRQQFVSHEIQPTKWLGDSPDRFDTYQRYAAQVQSVTEFGVYTGLSTCAWLMGRPQRLRSYDITDQYLTVLPELEHAALTQGTDFQFAIGNSLEINIEPVDLLFIDTVHKRDHARAEIQRHHAQVRRYMVFHDTADWPGVFQAVIGFVMENRGWHIVEHCQKNSGLTVLARYA
jgi:hypothetical protein